MREFILAKNLNARHDQSIHIYYFECISCDLCILRCDVLCKRKLEVETERERDEYLLDNGNKIIFLNLFMEFDVIVKEA